MKPPPATQAKPRALSEFSSAYPAQARSGAINVVCPASAAETRPAFLAAASAVPRALGLCRRNRRLSGERPAADEAVEMAALVVPLVISFGAPFSIALGRKPAAGDDSCQLHVRTLCRPCRDEFDRRQRLRPGRLHAARRLPLLRLADARAFRPHGEPRRSRRPRNRRAPPQAGRRATTGTRGSISPRRSCSNACGGDPPLSRAVASAYRELAFCHGNVRIDTIAARLGLEPQASVAAFSGRDRPAAESRSPACCASTGRSISPIARSQPDWADLAAECGYADQAHLTREFAEFAGTTPNRWQARAA